MGWSSVSRRNSAGETVEASIDWHSAFNRAVDDIATLKQQIKEMSGHLEDAWKTIEFERSQLAESRAMYETWRKRNETIRVLRDKLAAGTFDAQPDLKENLETLLSTERLL